MSKELIKVLEGETPLDKRELLFRMRGIETGAELFFSFFGLNEEPDIFQKLHPIFSGGLSEDSPEFKQALFLLESKDPLGVLAMLIWYEDKTAAWEDYKSKRRKDEELAPYRFRPIRASRKKEAQAMARGSCRVYRAWCQKLEGLGYDWSDFHWGSAQTPFWDRAKNKI